MAPQMPNHPGAALWQRAQVLFEQRNWLAAKAIYLDLLKMVPGHAQSLLQLSYVESHLGKCRSAREYAMRAFHGGLRRPELLVNLVARLRTFNEGEAFEASLKRLPPLSQIKIQPLLGFAAQLSYVNDQERALRFLDEAKRGDPEFPTTLMARGQVLTYLGRFDEAEMDFERCIKRAPQFAQAHWFVSRLRRQTADSNHVQRLRKQIGVQNADPESPAMLQYALHKELDDLGDVPGAWVALEKACKAKRALLGYHPDESRDLVDKLISWSSESARHPTSVGRGDGHRTPIFIVGMHRSGTTLLEQLLDGHGQVRGVGELYDFTCQMRFATDHNCRGVIDATIAERAATVDFSSVGSEYLRKMEWRLGAEPYFTDKLPSNFLNAGFICRALPHARILHMVRDPVETCFSNLRELFTDANPYSYDQLELVAFHRQYTRLMAHWHQAWPGRILDVDYADLTRDPEAVLRRVCDFCGLDFQPDMLSLGERKRGVATASAIQVRQEIRVREQPKWLPYKQYLQPLIQGLSVPS